MGNFYITTSWVLLIAFTIYISRMVYRSFWSQKHRWNYEHGKKPIFDCIVDGILEGVSVAGLLMLCVSVISMIGGR